MSIVLWLIVLIIFYVLPVIGFGMLFEKAGQKAWKAYVPFYNIFVMIELVGRPKYWIAFMFIPVINIIVYVGLALDMLKSYGKNEWYDILFAILFQPYWLYLGMQKDIKYLGKALELPKVKRSSSAEWTEAIVFAVVAATLIRWAFMEAYVIPTPSMENSLLVGDYLFVSKLNYGARTPKTPLQVPFTHAKLWGPLEGIPSYSDAIQLPQFRFPGLSKVERNDVVVFNYPMENQYPSDLRTHYIKRCIGVGGDTVEVRDTQVFINGEMGKNPENMQYRYQIVTDKTIHERVFAKNNIWDIHKESWGYIAHARPEDVEAFKSLDFVKDVSINKEPIDKVDIEIFPDASLFPWNADHFGPLVIPAKGMTIQLNPEMVAKYGSTIRDYENLDNCEVRKEQLVIDGQAVTEYTFTQDYYFMMGDNRHNSLDSRYWGFVPADHVVGEASFIFMSWNRFGTFFDKIRWGRLFNGID